MSMIVQWTNQGLWLLLLSVPNYSNIITQFPSMVRHAFSAIALYLPLTTVYPFIRNRILLGIDDSTEMIKSIWDYQGIDLSEMTATCNCKYKDMSESNLEPILDDLFGDVFKLIDSSNLI